MHKGFTLLELLLVMSILGLLAVVVFVAVNPAELMARSRDTGRITAVAVLGRAVTTYYTAKGGVYPSNANWDQELISTQAIASFPKGLEYRHNSITSCTTNAKPPLDPSYCYLVDTVNNNGAIVFTKLESTKQVNKCGLASYPYVAFSTEDGRAGILCLSADPIPWPDGSQSYFE
jgi:prepilin-type N-terminal cleavage/methylation domain-containing protein